MNVLPSVDASRSSDTKSFSSPSSSKKSVADIVCPACVKRAFAGRASTGSHAIAGSTRVPGASRHMSLNRVTVSARSISGPAASTMANAPSGLMRIVAWPSASRCSPSTGTPIIVARIQKSRVGRSAKLCWSASKGIQRASGPLRMRPRNRTR